MMTAWEGQPWVPFGGARTIRVSARKLPSSAPKVGFPEACGMRGQEVLRRPEPAT